MNTLEQKQAYYDYGQSGWDYKQPPTLDAHIHEALTRVAGRDNFGDPIFRFLWAGCAIIRKDPDTDEGELRGERAATKVIHFRDEKHRNRSRLMPRHPAGGKVHPRWVCYKNKKGETVRVARPEQVPEGAVAWMENEYIHYGRLKWVLERKLSPEQLIQSGVYREGDPHIPARGDYIWKLDIETPDYLYFEPTQDWINAVLLHEWENTNVPLTDLLATSREARETREAAQELRQDEADDAALDEIVRRAMNAPLNRTFILPASMRQASQLER